MFTFLDVALKSLNIYFIFIHFLHSLSADYWLKYIQVSMEIYTIIFQFYCFLYIACGILIKLMYS